MNLNEWAIKHEIPYTALEDLRRMLSMIDTDPELSRGLLSETDVQSHTRIEATAAGGRLWRNNNGGFYTETGAFVRYGLCNESKAMNKQIKSSDLIGIKPVSITQAHVGQIIGQFLTRECKPPGWSYSGSEHERAQLRFIELVLALGGDAQFVNGRGTI